MTSFDDLPATSFLRVFAAPRDLTPHERDALAHRVETFLAGWRSHENPAAGRFAVLHDRFLVVAADERVTALSGCSKDALVGCVRAAGDALGLELVHSPPIVFRGADGIRSVDRAEFGRLVDSGAVRADTPVFDTIVTTVGAYRDGGFEKPAAESWHARAWKLAPAV
ncbi:MAG: hypothetical protein R3F20_13490 [Planctomycetota bacterium]